jgi:hypothetical protein
MDLARGYFQTILQVRILPGAPTYPQLRYDFDQAKLAVGYLLAISFSAGQTKPRLLG